MSKILDSIEYVVSILLSLMVISVALPLVGISIFIHSVFEKIFTGQDYQ